jgi:hypothetical protein
MTKMPYYKLVIGRKPYTVADSRFKYGRVRIEVSNKHPGASKLLAELFDLQWGDQLRKLLAFWETSPQGTQLFEPHDRPLAAEVARLFPSPSL